MTNRPRNRRGAALVWALVILTVLGITSGVAVREFSAARRTLAMRHDRMQAEWLARSGVELATARLLEDAAYTGETVEPVTSGPVRIGVTKDGESYVIHCDAKYPAGDPRAATSSITRKASRKREGDKVSVVLTAVSDAPPAP